MSHTITIETEVKDFEILQKTCKSLDIPCTIKDGQAVIQLPGWLKILQVTSTGRMLYDNYRGHWGAEKELHKLLQEYSVSKLKAIAKKKRMKVREVREGGKVRLTLTR